MTFKMTLQCLVFLSVWIFLSVSVHTIRVPNNWNEQQGGFRRSSEAPIERRMFVENLQGLMSLKQYTSKLDPLCCVYLHTLVLVCRVLYIFCWFLRRLSLGYTLADPPLSNNPLQPNIVEKTLTNSKPRHTMVFDQGNLYVLPQNNPEMFPSTTKSTEAAGVRIPSILNPRYTENIPGQKENGAYEIHQTLPLTQKQVEAIGKPHQNPTKNNFDGNSALTGIPIIDKYRKQSRAREYYLLNQLPQGEYKEQPKLPNFSLISRDALKKQPRSPLDHSVSRHIPRNHKFVVPASDGDATLSPLGFQLKEVVERVGVSTQKEPQLFVTEGYRNVLVQGPNKQKQNNRPQFQQKDESRKVPSKEKAESGGDRNEKVGDDNEDKPQRRTKVTKIYKNHGDEGNTNNVDGSNQNSVVESGWKKPRRYFERPQVYTGDDRRSGLRGHLIKSYRDDTFHEPETDKDHERDDDDDDKFRIANDEEKQDADENQEDDKSPVNNHSVKEESTTGQNIPRVNESSNTGPGEEQNSQEEDDEEPDEEDANDQKDVPHSEHAEPKPVPSKPIYPGEGLWAKPGIKHMPHISPHRFIKPAEDVQKPDGYSVFEELNQYFESQKEKFGNHFGEIIDTPQDRVPSSPITHYIQAVRTPNLPNPLVVYDPFSEPNLRISNDRAGIVSSSTDNTDQIIKDKGTNYVVESNRQPENADVQEMSEDASPRNDKIVEAAEEEDEEVEEEGEEEEEGDEEADEFVPLRLYSQVRNSENVEHEPYNPLEHGRLREVIKDSKIQTVYTEEGYEDSAYDHAGHEKKAEQDQGYSEIEQAKEGNKPENAKENNGDNHGGQSKKVISGQHLVDSVASETVYPSKSTENRIENPVGIKFADQKVKSSRPSNTNSLISSQELKTTQIKDKVNGDVQLEIQSEVKVVMQPNNSTKAHKYVKIYPKVVSQIISETSELVDAKRAENGSIVTSNATNENAIGVLSSADAYQDANNITEIDPSTTESSTVSYIESLTRNSGLTKSHPDSFEKPKVVVKVLDNDGALKKISDNFEQIGGDLSRKKRDTNDFFEDVDIDTEFIDKINHTFAPPRPAIDVEKYPYYVLPGLNPNSPLRYAENMNNIPVKQEGELSFYKMADKMACPEIPQNIDPIPEHVKNAKRGKRETGGENESTEEDDEEADEEEDDDEEETDVEQKLPPTPKTPRIELGDKIDCLKVRYFGENPLDSPFFKEETVGPVKPIFKELDRKASHARETRKLDTSFNPFKTFEVTNKPNEIFDQSEKRNERKFESDVKDKIFNALSQSAEKFETNGKVGLREILGSRARAPFSFENEKAESIRSDMKELPPPVDNSLVVKPKPTASPLVTLITTPKYTIQLTPKNIYDQIKLLDHLPLEEETESTTTIPEKNIIKTNFEARKETTNEDTLNRMVEATNDEKVSSNNRTSKKLEFESGKVGEPKNIGDKAPLVLEPEALRRKHIRRPIYQIFDVNKFLTTTPFTLISPISTSILPKHKVLSEVYYKDEIKPSEQLNVFADVLNNIKNSSKLETVPVQSASNFAEPSAVTISTLDKPPKDDQSANIRVRKFQTDSSNSENSFEDDAPTLKPIIERPYGPNLPDSSNIEKHFYMNVSPDHAVPSTSTPKYKNIRFAHKSPNHIPSVDNTPIDLFEPKLARPGLVYSTSTQKATTYGSRKILKRRRKPTTSTSRTTTNISAPKESIPSNHQPYIIDFIEDTDQVVGLVPPQDNHYKTIMVDPDVENTNEVPQQANDYQTISPTNVFLAKPPAPVTETNDEAPPTRPMNKYYFLGLKPPPSHRARPYSEFANNNVQINDNLLRKRVAHVGFSRVKRNAARPTYADVSRNRGRQKEGLETASAQEDEADEYVPHRPQNYYYDEKTGKIVYRNKPKEKPEEEEVEYEEVEIPETPGIYLERAEGATHPPPPEKATTRLLLATATPPPEGKGLLDFVVKLKNDPNYVYIPDPTTPKPGTITSTTESIVTVDPKSTNPPEFLSILSKVKSDKNYKYIEDPKESQSKAKAKSTTPEPESDEDYVDEEEESEPGKKRKIRQATLKIFNIGDFLPKIQTPTSSNIPSNFFKKHVVERVFPKLRYMTPFDIAKEYYKQTELYKFIKKHIQNSPGGQNQDLANIQIFDIGDYLPKIKPVTPKTTIDYSKYKTIERPHTRHNISSKINSEKEESSEKEEGVIRHPYSPGGQPLTQEVVAEKTREGMEERESVGRPVVSEEKIGHDKTVEAVSTTTQKIVQLRRGTRPTTQRTTAETDEPIEVPTTKRNANRRKLVPSGFRSTRKPATTSSDTEATEKVERIHPENHSTERVHSDSHDKARRVYRRRPVRIRHTTERREEDNESIDKIVRRSLDSDPEAIRDDFDRQYLEDTSVEDTYEEVKQDILNGDNSNLEIDREEIEDKKASESKKREIAKTNIKDVEVIDKDYDKTQKHGGNYKSEIGEETQTKNAALEVTEEREQSEDVVQNGILKNNHTTNAPQKSKLNVDVEMINENHDKLKKYGGNYRRENENLEILLENDNISKEGSHVNTGNAGKVSANKMINNVQTIDENYDKPTKHGANYNKEQDHVKQQTENLRVANVVVDQIATENKQKNDDVEIIDDNYDKTKRHGGNYRRDGEEEEITEDESKEQHIPINTSGRSNVKDVEIINPQFDRTEKHGGNYKSEEDAVIDELLENGEKTQETYQIPKKARTDEIKYKNKILEKAPPNEKELNNDKEISQKMQTKRKIDIENSRVIPRLADVVPKPDHFYSDPSLPAQVNKLGAEKPSLKLGSEEVEQVASEGDFEEESDKPAEKAVKLERRNFDEATGGEGHSIVSVTSTEKPVLIKDPSKRLYFYAAV